ncbi:hypothetical protein F441_10628 [Phytophthora nicotianae CJ01A1]|uniref:Uncharacterized protein n=2 Tax=Phytophthora nicotianae TaxID=4792 RepID=W2IV44_PHYNI|nr:hypothetical protein L915_10445 [Phytophthora nicotianae]ETL38039.1 hypothetical protein L916_10338 [Phytophthora nicotianae]ETP14434.1 hypothetical protein F441_10628 [Phytophthora nicotianae CJ01A1]
MNHVEPTAKRSALESGEDRDLVEYFSDERYSSASRYPKKRCTKQKALRSDENVIIVDDNHDTESVTLRNHQISEDQIYGETQSKSGRRTEMDTYETALKLTASCAQLLKDVDLNLLRSVAEVAFRAASSESDNVQPRIHKLERYAERIQVALNCLSHRIAAIVEQSGSSSVSDATESEVHIPGFVSTGQGRLNLLQDVERYVLRVGQTLRHCHYNDPDTSSYSSDRSTKASDLRPLQRHIDKTTRELLELARRICGKTKRNLTIARGR